ncbi:MAG: MotA/TolQ/ExbB proton channel family protein [Candidatus Omnitrophica bacterium]|nr:MotA/TolQ/ExbB proton channel family protein [Candidatus Omnitrophota bacterium]MCB9721437.1 MotA/TolQ/ExbB proton channel family protein [Candidatus Omnitrophota bacterium]
MFAEMNIVTLFAKAGFTRWVLLVCSAVGAAIIAERFLYFLHVRLNYKKFSRELFLLLSKNQLMQAIRYCQSRPHPAARMAAVYLQNFRNSKRECILSREGTFLMEKVESRLRGLATIVHIAPLLGLLGTVAGLVAAFHGMESAAGPVQVKDLAGGIWAALLSTVFGLVIAIPCMLAYHTFESCADRIFRRMQSIVHELDAFFAERSQRPAEASSADPSVEYQEI